MDSNIVSLADRRKVKAEQRPNFRKQIIDEVGKINMVEALQRDVAELEYRQKRQAEIIQESMLRIMSLEERQLELVHYIRVMAEALSKAGIIP